MSSLPRILPFVQPISYLLEDPEITEVIVNLGGRRVFVERGGAVEEVRALKLDEKHLSVAIKNIARTCGDDTVDNHSTNGRPGREGTGRPRPAAASSMASASSSRDAPLIVLIRAQPEASRLDS